MGWVFDKCKVRGLVPCCGQYDLRVQVPKPPYIHTETYHIRMFLVTRYAIALIRSLLTK